MRSNSIILCLTIGMLSFGGAVVNVSAEPPAESQNQVKELSESELEYLAYKNWVTSPEKSFEYAKQLVDKYDSIYGKQYLAPLYLHGIGTSKNPKLAAEYYKTFLQKGDVNTELELINALCESGGWENLSEAEKRLEKLCYSLKYFPDRFFDALVSYTQNGGRSNIAHLVQSIANVDDVTPEGISALEKLYQITGDAGIKSVMIVYKTKANRR